LCFLGNQNIPIKNIHLDPEVEIVSYNSVIDSFNHWLSISPDGVISINGLYVGCLEIKCPWSKQTHALHENVQKYYYEQMMSQLYILQRYFPTITWLDKMNWSPSIWVADTFVFATQYYFEWFAPRAIRFYFEAFLPMQAQHLRNAVIEKAMKQKVVLATEEGLRIALQETLHQLYDWRLS
jgi:hypothetical protein